MASPTSDERRANRRFWLGVAAFLAALAVIVGLGLVCRADGPVGDPNPNAVIVTS